MKKFLFFAIVAIAMMACNTNDAEKEEKTGNNEVSLEECSKKVLALIGSAYKDADQAIIKAGFERVDSKIINNSPLRMPAKVKTSGFDEKIYYVYNLPEKYMKNGGGIYDEEGMMGFINDVVSSGKMTIVLQADYEGDILYSFDGIIITSASNSDMKKLYTTCSDNIYSSIPSGFYIKWGGYLIWREGREQVDSHSYSDHSNYMYDLKRETTYSTSYEKCGCSNENRWYYYEMDLSVPNDSEKSVMREDGYKPFIYGSFDISGGYE